MYNQLKQSTSPSREEWCLQRAPWENHYWGAGSMHTSGTHQTCRPKDYRIGIFLCWHSWNTNIQLLIENYRHFPNIRRNKFQTLNVSCLVLQLSLPNPLKPGVKPGIKMQLEQRRQTMIQLHLNDQQFHCLLRICLILYVWCYMHVELWWSQVFTASLTCFENLLQCWDKINEHITSCWHNTLTDSSVPFHDGIQAITKQRLNFQWLPWSWSLGDFLCGSI